MHKTFKVIGICIMLFTILNESGMLQKSQYRGQMLQMRNVNNLSYDRSERKREFYITGFRPLGAVNVGPVQLYYTVTILGILGIM